MLNHVKMDAAIGRISFDGTIEIYGRAVKEFWHWFV